MIINTTKTKIYIDSAADIHYSSYYIKGLIDIYGRNNIFFSSKYFKKFKHNNHFLAFVINENNNFKKIIIDFADTDIISDLAYEWCDIYGKINLNFDFKNKEKIVAIGPSFGIKIFNFNQTIFYSLSNYFKSYKRIDSFKKFFSDYKAQYYRPKLIDYENAKPVDSYIFFVSSLWKKEKKTNDFRANFIKSCLNNSKINFEGGFAPRTRNDITGFEDITMNGRIQMADYIIKCKKSFIAFNTPAVLDCHGWKLGEYIAMNKIIISTTQPYG